MNDIPSCRKSFDQESTILTYAEVNNFVLDIKEMSLYTFGKEQIIKGKSLDSISTTRF